MSLSLRGAPRSRFFPKDETPDGGRPCATRLDEVPKAMIADTCSRVFLRLTTTAFVSYDFFGLSSNRTTKSLSPSGRT